LRGVFDTIAEQIARDHAVAAPFRAGGGSLPSHPRVVGTIAGRGAVTGRLL
jgi:hypothetical protein